MSHPGHSLREGVLLLCREAVGVFCSPKRLNKLILRLCGKMNGCIISPSLVTSLNNMMWTGCLLFLKSVFRLPPKHCETFKLKLSEKVNCITVLISSRINSADPSLVYSRINMKQIKRMRETRNLKWRQFTHDTLSVYKYVCLYIYIYIYIYISIGHPVSTDSSESVLPLVPIIYHSRLVV